MGLPNISEEEITTLKEAKNVIEQLVQFCHKQQEAIEQLRVENARLKGQPKKPQFVSSKHTSFSVSKLLNGNDKKWHKSIKRGTLAIDQHLRLPEQKVCVCGNKDFTILRTHTKVVQGILFQRNNTAYHGREKQCANCGKRYKSILPQGLTGVSFDPNLTSLISYLKFACRMTQPLLYRMFTGMGISISHGEIDVILLKNSDTLQPAYHHLKTVGFTKSFHLQSDATGAKRKEKQGNIRNQYAQVISNKLLSVFSITRYYNIQTLNRLLGKDGKSKPFVGDDGSPNGGCACRYKQVCWVHEIRHYKKLFPFFNTHQKLQEQILSGWRAFYHLAKQYGSDPPKTATRVARQAIEELFEKITAQITEYDDLNRQLKLTRRKKDRLLLFLDYPFLPIHNNQCEQDLRQFVIIRKISGETKSVRGDRSIARHLSVIQTAQKQGLDVYQTLRGLLIGQLAPAVLTANIS